MARSYWQGYKEELDKAESLPMTALLMLNNFGFMELASGHLPEAQQLFERAASRGGLAETMDRDLRLMLLCNLAATSSGLGEHTMAQTWARDARGLATQPTSSKDEVGILAVYVPDPDWPKRPLLVSNPDVLCVALGTEAGAAAAMDDPNAADMALELCSMTDAPWVADVLHGIGKRLNRPDLIERARSWQPPAMSDA
jgi:hypothetical protein